MFGCLRKKYFSGLSVWLQKVKAFLVQALSLNRTASGMVALVAEPGRAGTWVLLGLQLSQSSAGTDPVWSLPHSELKLVITLVIVCIS